MKITRAKLLQIIREELSRLDQPDISSDPISETLKKVKGKWAIVSKNSGRVLRYYKGKGKPSEDWVNRMEREINYFKHRG